MPSFHFKGKTFLQNYHHTVKFHKLKAAKNKGTSKTPSLDDNLLIQGDNLKALKALLPTHAGKVKCIYIDPPYNTGNENWIYNDNVASSMIQQWLGKEVGLDDLARHDKWCCMMYPRLVLLRELLTDDGVIFISIDDNEVHRLRMMMDEIFGDENFVCEFVWAKKKKPSFLHKNVGKVTEYVLCYLKNSETAFPFSVKTTEEGKKYPLNNAGNSISTLVFPEGSVRFKCKDAIVEAQDMSEGNIITELLDAVTIKDGKNANEFRLKGEWRYSQKKLEKILESGDQIIISKAPFRPNHIKRGGEIKKMGNLLTKSTYDVPTNEDATKEIEEILGNKKFDNPKPSDLIKLLIKGVTYEDSSAIVLDSFAGSGTTGHAVLSLNQEDGGDRKFILVECEDYADEITAERLRRVIKGVPKAKDEKLCKGLGASFSYYELGPELEMDKILEGKDLPDYEELARYAFFTATGENWGESKVERDSYYIGSSSSFEVYMLYEPDKKKLKELALSLDFAMKAQKRFPNRQKLIFAPACFMEESHLKEYGIRFAQLPFEIYRMAE